ncbi:uncharacterized protein JN550_009245 [Neoarthrinium moseri]|uniref:uncharacterized protein n=1 Tax=Neoarthrinium moseri TaxID=1658444 RepID=UPI001FDCE111|nr:uncharacterized protein JN550_009245 [Neoarthrinium moseri]KAI1863966.1 hypothetical protein JN550_009245 [Neoarthrinium moseri]
MAAAFNMDEIYRLVDDLAQTTDRFSQLNATGYAPPTPSHAEINIPDYRMLPELMRSSAGPRQSRHRRPTSQTTSSTRYSSTWDRSSYQGSAGSYPSTSPSTRPSRRSLPESVVGRIAARLPNQGIYVLPCEFAAYTGCDASFDLEDIDNWIEHTISHLHDRPPPKSMCWFCDEVDYHADKHRFDARTIFEYRMHHIRDHIRDERYTVWDMRPDYHFIDHLDKYDIIGKDVIDTARSWCEGPSRTMEGIYNHDFIPPSQPRSEYVPYDTRAEDRERQRQQRRQRQSARGHR